MAAAAALKPAAGNAERSIIADIDAVRTAQPAVATSQIGEGGLVYPDCAGGIVCGQDTLFAVAEIAVVDGQIAALQPDARAIAIGNGQILEDHAVYGRTLPAQDERRLALANAAIEHRATGRGGAIGDTAALLHGAVAANPRGNEDGAAAIADRVDRVLQRAIAPAAFGHAVGRGGLRRSGLGKGGRSGAEQAKGEQDGQLVHGRDR